MSNWGRISEIIYQVLADHEPHAFVVLKGAVLAADPGLRAPEHAPLLDRVRALFADHRDMFN